MEVVRAHSTAKYHNTYMHIVTVETINAHTAHLHIYYACLVVIVVMFTRHCLSAFSRNYCYNNADHATERT